MLICVLALALSMTVYAAAKAIMGEDDMAELSSADNAVPRKPSSMTSAKGRQAYDKVQGLSCVLSMHQSFASLSVAQEVFVKYIDCTQGRGGLQSGALLQDVPVTARWVSTFPMRMPANEQVCAERSPTCNNSPHSHPAGPGHPANCKRKRSLEGQRLQVALARRMRHMWRWQGMVAALHRIRV